MGKIATSRNVIICDKTRLAKTVEEIDLIAFQTLKTRITRLLWCILIKLGAFLVVSKQLLTFGVTNVKR